jgi:hypothetical protein
LAGYVKALADAFEAQESEMKGLEDKMQAQADAIEAHRTNMLVMEVDDGVTGAEDAQVQGFDAMAAVVGDVFEPFAWSGIDNAEGEVDDNAPGTKVSGKDLVDFCAAFGLSSR